jgi:hypothetical protein
MSGKPPLLFILTNNATIFNLVNASDAPRHTIAIKNRCAVACTIDSNSNIFDVGAIEASPNISLPSGATVSLASDGLYWYVISKQ